jgi:hypothetical protein
MTKKEDSMKEMSKEEISREEKKRLRKAALGEHNPLAIDESLKKPGMVYRLCNVTPGNIDKYRRMGYEVVQNPIHKGTEGLGEAKTASGCVEVSVGKSSDLKAVWMETSEENYEILREIELDKAREQDKMIYKSEIPEENRIGKVTRDFSK